MILPVSIVIVSRGRPAALMQCLTGVAQLDYAPFEVVVVACPAGVAAVAARPDAVYIKLVQFDEANISAARNLGIARAAGEIVAFIDDDAVPEPLWLRHLTGPFDGSDLACVGGYVIGRNGISFQWQARSVDMTGAAHDLALPGTDAVAPDAPDGHVIKTEGTSMAVRRDVLAAVGGFDPAYRFYLDETDLNMRLARAEHLTAIAPMAQVHHGFAESPRRGRDRSPRDLHDIGASQMVFLRKFCAADQRDAVWRDFARAQRRRLLRFMQRGPLGPDDVARLMHRLQAGGREGAVRPLAPLPPIPPAEAFLPYPGRPGAPRMHLSGCLRNAADLRAKAQEQARDGAIVSLFLFDRTARYHRVRMTPQGIWEQTGGLYGRSLRRTAPIRAISFSSRVNSEIMRIRPVRG